jgi:hypothetical protein
MSGITHEWNGTVLTITSDSGTSSMDLQGHIGDTGPRGPQGPCGLVMNEDGEIIVNLNDYATLEDVQVAIAEAQLRGAEADLSVFVTENEFKNGVSKQVNDALAASLEDRMANYALKEEIPTVPTKVSELENDTGFVTSKYVDESILGCNLDNYYTKAEVDALIPTSAEEVEY